MQEHKVTTQCRIMSSFQEEGASSTFLQLMSRYGLTEGQYNQQVSDTHLEKLSRSGCKQWKSLPPHLELEATVAEDIDKSQKREREKRHDFLLTWKEMEGSDATYRQLITALLKIKCRRDAEKLSEMLKQSIPQSQLPIATASTSSRCAGEDLLPPPAKKPKTRSAAEPPPDRPATGAADTPPDMPATSLDLDPNSHIYKDLKRKLNKELRNVTARYATYVRHIRITLQANGVTAKDLCATLLNFSVFNHTKQEIILVSSHRAELERATDLCEVFSILSTEYASFLNDDIFRYIVDTYQIDHGQEELKYHEHLIAYLEKHKVSEFIELNPHLKEVTTGSSKLVLKVNVQATSRLSKIKELESAIADMLDLKSATLQLLDISKGCVVVTFLIPTHIAEIVFHKHRVFTETQVQILRTRSILRMECIGYMFEDTDYTDQKDEQELPSTIDPTVATDAFKKHRKLLLNLMLIRHCFFKVVNSLYTETIIPRSVYELAYNEKKGSSEKVVALLHCLESRIEAAPSDFIKVVNILEEEPFLELIAKDLVKSYCAISKIPTIGTLPVTSSAISNYHTYLKTVYKRSPISLDSKWPPSPSRKYISLTVVEGGRRCRDEYIGRTLQSNTEQKEILIEQLFETKGRKRLKLVLVEGAPGIGKTTLAWELCRKWEEFSSMEQYGLVVLLRLREEEVQKITNIKQLFFSHDCHVDTATIAREVAANHGRGILFILDGFDELPKPLQQKGFLLNLIKGQVLSESTVLVTSRPSATGELLSRPSYRLIEKQVEILGFTQESVELYATSIFSSEPEKLKNFRAYISASKNPAINSLMCVPLNAAIIVEIYRDCQSEQLLPHTLTELYTQVCLTILNRHLQAQKSSASLKKFVDLPPDMYQQFLDLSKLAFESFEDDKAIFHAIPSTLVHFGFLDMESALYGGDGLSYNFLHLTVQEFFVAYYISHLGSNGLKLLELYGEVQRWNIVWRFVAGLTKFRYYEGQIDRNLFFAVPFSMFLPQCLFEAQSVKYFTSILKASSPLVRIEARYPVALDAYVLGYCIANFPIGVPWDVKITGGDLHSFKCGLKTRMSCEGVISQLNLKSCRNVLTDLKSYHLHGTTALHLVDCELTSTDMVYLSELIPHMPCLEELYISGNCIIVADVKQDGLLKVLHQLYNSNVTSLDIRGTVSSHDHLTAVKRLIRPSSGKLKHLALDDYTVASSDIVSAPSSLESLELHTESAELRLHALHLKNNTNLTTLSLHLAKKRHFNIDDLVDIIHHNKTLKKLFVGYNFHISEMVQISEIVHALRKNCTLQKIILQFHCPGFDDEYLSHYMTTHHKSLTLDSRIKYEAWRP